MRWIGVGALTLLLHEAGSEDAVGEGAEGDGVEDADVGEGLLLHSHVADLSEIPDRVCGNCLIADPWRSGVSHDARERTHFGHAER